MSRHLVDRESIIEWATAHAASPARVATTSYDESDPGLRLEFKTNGHGSDELLISITWDEWFQTFDARGLALVVDDGPVTH